MKSSLLRSPFSFAFLAAFVGGSLATVDAAAEPEPRASGPEPLRPSLAIERVGGISYTRASADTGEARTSLTAFAIGGVALNPYTAPRLGLDFPIFQGLTVGASGGISRMSLSAGDSDRTVDIGTLTVYSLTPRVGYTLRPHERFDLSFRAGVMLAGGSVKNDDDDGGKVGVFTTALDLEAVGAIRVTPSFNVLVGFAFDRTLSGSVSQSGTSFDEEGGSSSTQNLNGGATSGHLWLGLGGYL